MFVFFFSFKHEPRVVLLLLLRLLLLLLRNDIQPVILNADVALTTIQRKCSESVELTITTKH